MGKAGIRHPRTERACSWRERPWQSEDQSTQRTTLFFDLEPLLAAGLEAREVNRARRAIEHRVQRMVRKKDRIVWTARGFYLLIASIDADQALAAAERLRQDIVAALRNAPAGAQDEAPVVRRAQPEEIERVSLMCA